MLTVDFARLQLQPGVRVLDVGCGNGRHAFEALRRGAEVIATDLDGAALADVERMAAAMALAGEVGDEGSLRTCSPPDERPAPEELLALLPCQKQPQSEDRALGHRLAGVRQKLAGDRTGFKDGVAPFVEANHLREQLGAETVAVAADPVDLDLIRHLKPPFAAARHAGRRPAGGG